jgi:hypothetical protein
MEWRYNTSKIYIDLTGLFGVYGLLKYCNAWVKGALGGILTALDGKYFGEFLLYIA